MLIVSMKDILKRYDSKVVLDYVNLDIAQGEIVGLLGPNGAGKTTLIHTLTGIIPYDQGRIQLFGKTVKGLSNEVKQQLGLVTQEITIYEELTARENLEFFAGIYGLKGQEQKKRVDEALEFVGLTERARMVTRKFSGGMKRRLNIACALTHRPKLLIMDEPTVGIDPQSRNRILELVKELQARGTTIIYTSHYMEEVEAIASRVVIMDQGQIIAEGTTQDLIQKIQHEEKIYFDVTDPDAVPLEKLRQLTGVKQVSRQGSHIQVITAAGAGSLDRLLSIVKEYSPLVGIQSEKPNLGDVFLTLTGKQLRDGEEEQ